MPSHSLILPAILALTSILLTALGDSASHWLRFDRAAIMHGELWRLLSGNLVHLGWHHLWMNLAGLLLIWAIFQRLITPWHWFVVLLGSAMGVGLGLLIFNPNLNWYVGLSGALHGLLMAGIVASLVKGFRLEWLLLLFVIGKLLWEQLYGAMPGSANLAGGPVIVDAHLYGAVSGTLTALLIAAWDRARAAYTRK